LQGLLPSPSHCSWCRCRCCAAAHRRHIIAGAATAVTITPLLVSLPVLVLASSLYFAHATVAIASLPVLLS